MEKEIEFLNKYSKYVEKILNGESKEKVIKEMLKEIKSIENISNNIEENIIKLIDNEIEVIKVINEPISKKNEIYTELISGDFLCPLCGGSLYEICIEHTKYFPIMLPGGRADYCDWETFDVYSSQLSCIDCEAVFEGEKLENFGIAITNDIDSKYKKMLIIYDKWFEKIPNPKISNLFNIVINNLL